jgi:hypothetical protein
VIYRPCVDCEPGSRRPTRAPGPRCATHARDRRKSVSEARWAAHIEKTYGITAEEYWAVYEAQGRVCAICQRATGKTRKLAVDHDHKTGEPRGILCSPCNRGVLGHLRDDPEALRRAADYLEHPPAREVLDLER